jgi:hypothetical protein
MGGTFQPSLVLDHVLATLFDKRGGVGTDPRQEFFRIFLQLLLLWLVVVLDTPALFFFGRGGGRGSGLFIESGQFGV